MLAIIIVRLDPIAPASRFVDDDIPLLFDRVCAKIVDAHHSRNVGVSSKDAQVRIRLKLRAFLLWNVNVGKRPDPAEVRDIGSLVGLW